MKLMSGLAFEFASTTNQDILKLDKILRKL
jgi:hypothetical protein